MKRRTALLCAAVAGSAVLLVGCGSATGDGPGTGRQPVVGEGPAKPRSAGPACPGEVADTGAAPTTVDGTPADDPRTMALAQAIGDQGMGAFADVYSTQARNGAGDRVTLCVTDLERGRDLMAAAKKADPTVDLGHVDLYWARFTERRLMAAVDKVITAKHLAFPLYTGTAEHDGSGVRFESSEAGAASEAFRHELEKLTGGVPVRVVPGDPVKSDLMPKTADLPRP
ncbi:hypothetical protein [Streptomyces sp. NPDC089919]|uniref:hypothetical protein n=1 Tax=Streptomyces sp. NPDC089919 TaxID=3155188 RepID=UPI00342F734C